MAVRTACPSPRQRLGTAMLLVLASIGASHAASGIERTEIRLVADLDEPRGYCLDIVGHQARARPDRGLHAHTCSGGQGYLATDQAFDAAALRAGTLRLPDWDRCLAVTGNESSRRVTLAPCDGSTEQRFERAPTGEIMPRGAPGECLGVDDAAGRPGGGGRPPHLIRALSVTPCGGERSPLQRWRIPTANP